MKGLWILLGMFRENDNPYVVANEPFDIKDYDENYYVNLHTEDGFVELRF